MFVLSVREVMSHPVVTLQAVEKVSTVVEILKNERHDGFPVVENVDPGVSTQTDTAKQTGSA